MRITPLDMRQQRFSTAMQGLRPTEVVAFLTEAADDYEHALREIDRLRQDLMRMEALLAEHRERENNLRNTLLTAQRLADEIKESAQTEAKLIVREAQGRADLLLQKAQGRLEEVERDINELRLRRRDVEGSLEGIDSGALPRARVHPRPGSLRRQGPPPPSAPERRRSRRRRSGRRRRRERLTSAATSPDARRAAAMAAELIFHHCRQLITCAGRRRAAGPIRAALAIVTDGAVAVADGRIVFAGRPPISPITSTSRQRRASSTHARCSIVPGFVDAHTHAMFAGDRRDELRRRLAGETYAEIAAAGGGIVVDRRRDARAPRGRARLRSTRVRLAEMLALRHDDVRDQERLRTRPRVRAEDAAGDPARSIGEQPIDLVADVHGRARDPARLPRRRRELRRPGRSTR